MDSFLYFVSINFDLLSECEFLCDVGRLNSNKLFCDELNEKMFMFWMRSKVCGSKHEIEVNRIKYSFDEFFVIKTRTINEHI